MMVKRLGMAVLLMHLIVIGLAIPVSAAVFEADPQPLFAILVLQILAVGALRSAAGKYLGWAAEVLAVLVAYNNIPLLVLNLIFLAIWFYSQKIGSRIDRDRAAAAAA